MRLLCALFWGRLGRGGELRAELGCAGRRGLGRGEGASALRCVLRQGASSITQDRTGSHGVSWLLLQLRKALTPSALSAASARRCGRWVRISLMRMRTNHEPAMRHAAAGANKGHRLWRPTRGTSYGAQATSGQPQQPHAANATHAHQGAQGATWHVSALHRARPGRQCSVRCCAGRGRLLAMQARGMSCGATVPGSDASASMCIV